MTRQGINEAKKLAKQFVAAADICIRQLDGDNHADGYISGTCLSGHLRRLSLELTRALAVMRKP